MKTWAEKTKVEKGATILSWVALLAWLVFEILGRMTIVPFANFASSASLFVVCASDVVIYWNEKRYLSYIALAAAILLAAVSVAILILG